jgi:tetratricopeptide (TPR) repeat protein
VAVALLAAEAIRAIPAGRMTLFGAPAVRTVAVLLLAALMTGGIVTQQIYWADNLLLYYRGVTVAPGNNLGRGNLANEALARGLAPQAIRLYQQVLRRNPGDWQCSYNLGYAYYRLGRYAEAEQQMERTARLNPSDADTAYYLGLSRLRQQKWQAAAGPLSAAIELDPRARGYRYALGLVLEHQGRWPEALALFQAELAKRPGAEPPQAHIAELEQRLRSN